MSALALGAICAAFVGSSTENYRNGEFLGRELPGDISRDQVVLKAVNDAATSWLTGTVLGKIVVGALAAVAGGGNTGAGTLGALASAVNTKVGAYLFTCFSVTGGYWFSVADPNGKIVGIVKATGAPQTISDMTFTLTDSGAHFVIGDTFTVTVAAGSGKCVILNPAALDGSQNASAILYATQYMGGANDVNAAVVNYGATVATGLIVWPAGITNNQKAAAIAQLNALGIKFRANV